ncbi:MAG: hypothetical protein QF570_13310 [Myxococcota bacterium]|jgi:hypothetical protein|nr:hypothetical protein [Myxococcota bacterium]
MSESENRVLNGQTWDEFCDALKEAGQIVQSKAAPDNAFDKAEGYRYLTRLLRAGLESFLEHGDPDFPQLRCPVHTTIKIGADNPDNYYQTCSINPGNDYLIKGTRGTVDYLGLCIEIGPGNRDFGTDVTQAAGHVQRRAEVM